MRSFIAGAVVAGAIAAVPAYGADFCADGAEQAIDHAKKTKALGRSLLGGGIATVVIALPIGIGAGFIYDRLRGDTFGCDNCFLGTIGVGAAATGGVALAGIGLVVSGAALMSQGNQRMWDIEDACNVGVVMRIKVGPTIGRNGAGLHVAVAF